MATGRPTPSVASTVKISQATACRPGVLLRWAITQYRERVYARLKRVRMFQAITATKLYNFYRLFRP